MRTGRPVGGPSGRLLSAAVAGALAFVLLLAAASAGAAPKEGRWVARGHGVDINFLVTRAGARLIVASPVAFCGAYGEPQGENFSPGLINDQGTTGEYGVIARRGRLDDLPFFSGRLGHSKGRITWENRYGVEAPPELGGASCPGSAYRGLRAEYLGPVRVKDGLWQLSGSLGTSGWIEVYGGASLVRVGGAFIGPPNPAYPEAGPCMVVAGGAGAGILGGAIPIKVYGSSFLGGATVNVFGIIDSLVVGGHFTEATWAYGAYRGWHEYPVPCVAPGGFWVARLKKEVEFPRLPPAPGPKPSKHPPDGPGSHWPGPPDIGSNDFRCDNGLEQDDPPRDELCKIYVRGPNEQIQLLWGNKKFGFRHIRKRHGFSTKTDGLIALTLVATPDPQPDGEVRYEREFADQRRSCVVRVAVKPEVGVYTAFVLGYADGRFSRCPSPTAKRPVVDRAKARDCRAAAGRGGARGLVCRVVDRAGAEPRPPNR